MTTLAPDLDPRTFIDKWKGVEIGERATAQSHFLDLCRLLGEDDPITADPKGEWFTFEKGVAKTTGAKGWADVWRRGCFGWEYKGKGKNLDRAFAQLQQYSPALENPPLLIVCDTERFRIHTNWTALVPSVHEFTTDDLLDADARQKLKWAFTDPDQLKPAKSRQALTEEAAATFAGLAKRLRERGHDAEVVAHFVNRLVFCMFAEDVDLLPNHMFRRMLEGCVSKPETFAEDATILFGAMRAGGKVGFEAVEWFNGGLFDSDEALPLDKADVKDVLAAAKLDWSAIDPAVLGTLFERGLDPDKRSQLGAHYTDRDKIMLIVNPVVVEPLAAEWAETKAKIEALIEKAPRETRDKLLTPAQRGRRTKAINDAEALKEGYLKRLREFRVLDPACGSGNFLNIALTELKTLEHRANLDAEALGLARGFPTVGPECVLGIELNPYAAELARVSVWIAEIQWMRRNGFPAGRNPILKPLDTIECRDALLNADGTRAEWPKADAVVGNPPFLYGSKMIGVLGEFYTACLRSAWSGLIRGGADLVLYWFAKAGEMLRTGDLRRAGFVSTNSIRGGINRATLTAAIEGGRIFEAWSDEPWIADGAAVRVSLVCVDAGVTGPVKCDGEVVEGIYTDLAPRRAGACSVDLTLAERLPQNGGMSCYGSQEKGSFGIDPMRARSALVQPNPHGSPNSDVVKKAVNGLQITRRRTDSWVVDFGIGRSEAEASLYETPFAIVAEQVRSERLQRRDKGQAKRWWLHARPSPKYREALGNLGKCIATPAVSKFRLFVWITTLELADHQLVIIARDDDTAFGILHSRFHELWSLRMGTWLGAGNDPRYTPSTTFETFPFPEGLTPNIPAANYADDPRAKAIAEAAARLNELRENWLNPPDLVDRVPEVVEGYPDRIVPKDDKAAKLLKKRTLTNLYNERPAWLDHAHRALDAAVADAYGWGEDYRAGRLNDDEILARLFTLNQARAGKE